MRLVIFGDTGGHYEQLVASLLSLKVNIAEAVIPEDLTIVHVGDLIHKGPDTSKVVELVDRLMKGNPDQWVQLLGNHEAQHVNPGQAPQFWECDCTLQDVTVLQSWWNTGLMKIAWGNDDLVPASFNQLTEDGSLPVPWSDTGVLIVHGGLTRFWWEKVLKKTGSAVEAAALLNDENYQEVTVPGLLLGYPNNGVGPVWAIGNVEVYPSWYKPFANGATGLPFHIIHGHTSSFKWEEEHPDNQWWPMISNAFKKNTVVNHERRAIVTDIGGVYLIGIDPGFEVTTDLTAQPFVELEFED